MSRIVVSALWLATLLSAPALQAQNPPSAPPPRAAAAGPGEIRGKVVDSVSGRAVPTAAITVRRASDSSFASGALVREDGSFRVEGLSPGTYVVRIRSLGYVQVSRSSVAITA